MMSHSKSLHVTLCNLSIRTYISAASQSAQSEIKPFQRGSCVVKGLWFVCSPPESLRRWKVICWGFGAEGCSVALGPP